MQQVDANELYQFCIDTGVPQTKINPNNILDFYSASLSIDQLKGLFAQKIILVEGETELFSLPYYFDKVGFNLDSNGVEIVNCDGKNNIAKYYRFFKTYGYQCFCIFDADNHNHEQQENKELVSLLNISIIDVAPNAFNVGNEYGCFGHDYETYLRNTISEYSSLENLIKAELITGSKRQVARAVSQKITQTPDFIRLIAKKLQ